MSKKLVIVGGVAGGATAAARAMRLNNSINCTIFERSPHVSFANCGLPYYIGREITDRSLLSLHTAESLKEAIGVTKVAVNTEVQQIDRKAKAVHVKDLLTNEVSKVQYDTLVLSPGASPFVPPVPGVNDPRIYTLRNLYDMDKMDKAVHDARCKNVVVIGAGFIGLECVEQLHRLGKNVTLVERSPAVLPQTDVEMARFLHAPLEKAGINVVVGDGLKGFNPTAESITVETESGKTIPADLVVLCIGVRPDTAIAKAADLQLAERGQIEVNDYMQTSDPSIYAVGDAVVTKDMVFPDRKAWVALGNVANMQARIAADHLVTGKSIPYRGSLGTSIVRAFNMVLALTGWNETRLKAAGIPHVARVVTQPSHASYYPGAMPITLKTCFCPESGRILGAQAVGEDGVDKRIDVMATAIQGGLTIDDVSLTQLTYSPPFGAARDVVNVAALAARNERDGLVESTKSLGEGRKLLDVRIPCDHDSDVLPGVQYIPWQKVGAAIKNGELDKKEKYTTLCQWGKTAYFAHRSLKQAGYDVQKIDGGRLMQLSREQDKPGSKL